MRIPHRTPPITCRPLPNSRRGESAPAASAATWGGRTATPRQTIDSEPPTSQVGRKRPPMSIRKVGAVVDRGGELPGAARVGSRCLEPEDTAFGRVRRGANPGLPWRPAGPGGGGAGGRSRGGGG